MMEISRILGEGIDGGLFQAATFRAFDRDRTLLEVAAGGCAVSSIFDIASITKVFTALVFARLQARGVVRAEDGLRDLDCVKPPADKGDITLLSLLAHTSGLPGYVPFYRLFAGEGGAIEPAGRREAYGRVVAEIMDTPLMSPPLESIRYSDPGYILLGFIIEQLLGTSLDQLMDELVTAPADLADTCFLPLGRYHECETGRFVSSGFCPHRSREVVGEVEDMNCYVLGGVSGHAGLFSTGYDLEKLGREIIRARSGQGGVFDAGEVAFLLREERDAHGSRRRVGFDVPSGEGSLAGSYFSEDSAGHLGFTGVSLWLDLAKETGMVLLANRVYRNGDREEFNGLRRRIHDAAWELLAS